MVWRSGISYREKLRTRSASEEKRVIGVCILRQRKGKESRAEQNTAQLGATK